jgi:hypothetical protein
MEAVEHLYLDELDGQQQHHLILLQNVCPSLGQSVDGEIPLT